MNSHRLYRGDGADSAAEFIGWSGGKRAKRLPLFDGAFVKRSHYFAALSWKSCLLGALIALIGGCSSSDNESSKIPHANDVALTIENAAKPPLTPFYLANGELGLRTGADGTGSSQGNPLQSFRASAYHTTGEEKLIPQPTWLLFDVKVDGKAILAAPTKYKVTTPVWSFDAFEAHWESNGVAYEVTVSLHPDRRSITQAIRIQSPKSKSIEFSVFSPEAWDRHDSTAVVEGRESTIKLDGKDAHLQVTLDGAVPRVSTVLGEALWTQHQLKCESSKPTVRILLERVIGPAQPAVANRPNTELEIEGAPDDAQALLAFFGAVRSSVSLSGGPPVGPMGLSSATYNGHIFWDADVWIFPALALLDPTRARAIPTYRLAKAEAARRNFRLAKSWARSAPEPAAIEKIDALQYPWESSVSGLETSPTETKQQHHITGSVVWAGGLAADLGLAQATDVNAVGRLAANFYKWRSVPASEGATERTIRGVISPDEYHFGDSDMYTNCVAEWTLHRFGGDPKAQFLRPKDANGFLNYAGDAERGYKQAAGALAIYPLQDPQVEPQARVFLERFDGKFSKNGPAMTDSLHALIWARLGETDRAYTVWRKSWQDFARDSNLMFSEKRAKDASYFVTGAAGCLQTALYGFFGIRIDTQAQPEALWSQKLASGKVISIRPHLPKQWSRVRLSPLWIDGRAYRLELTSNSVNVQPMKG